MWIGLQTNRGAITGWHTDRLLAERRGQSVVLVHGSTLDHTVWHAVLPKLESDFTLYAMDRRGRAASGDGATFCVEREVEDVAAVVERIGGDVHVMGHSYGALIALEATPLSPNTASLLLYDPPMISMGPDELAPGLIEAVEDLTCRQSTRVSNAPVLRTSIGSNREGT